MAIIVETGSGLPNSNSYASIAVADAYFTDRKVVEWTETPTVSDKEAALIRATDTIDASYTFRSVKLNDEQALECPRFPYSSLNAQVVKATIELARIMLTQPLETVATPKVSEESKSLEGVGSVSKKYVAGSSDPFPTITKILSGVASYRGASASTIKLIIT